jgi:Icc-related predicted phosphoesterase
MTKIVVISDTHGQHLGMQIPDGDILIHCGDFSSHGEYIDALKFVNWFGAHPHKHKIFIAGNHDLYFEQGNPSDIDSFLRMMPAGVHYLQDSGVELEGLKFWGSPVQPTFFNWAFNRDRGAPIKKHWDLIPQGTDVLITHGPPYKICDTAPAGNGFYKSVGCVDLLNAILKIQPKLHLFGHIHFSGGNNLVTPKTIFANASICDEAYLVNNKPLVINVDSNKQFSIATVT